MIHTQSFKAAKDPLSKQSSEPWYKQKETKSKSLKRPISTVSHGQKTESFHTSPKTQSPPIFKALTPNNIDCSHRDSKHLNENLPTCKTLSRDSKNFEINPGKRLYLEGLEKERMKEMKIFKILAERKALEEGLLTFKPSINQTSSNRLKKKQDLAEKKRLLSEKLLGLKAEQENEEMKKCTFRPEVNKSSVLMDKVKTPDRAAYLFYSSEIKRRKNDQGSFKSQTQAKIQEVVERVFHQKDPKTPKFRLTCRSSNREEFKTCSSARSKEAKRSENSHFSYKLKHFQKLNKSWKLIRYEEVDISNENFRIY